MSTLNPPTPHPSARRKHLVLLAMAFASFASGAIDQYFYPGVQFPPTSMGAALVGMFLIFLWYRLDARQAGYRRSRGLDVGILLLALVALPYYFFRSRGARRGALATLGFLGAYVVCSALTVAGVYATYQTLQA